MTDAEIRFEIDHLYTLLVVSRLPGREAEYEHYRLAVKLLREECLHTKRWPEKPVLDPLDYTFHYVAECCACGKTLPIT